MDFNLKKRKSRWRRVFINKMANTSPTKWSIPIRNNLTKIAHNASFREDSSTLKPRLFIAPGVSSFTVANVIKTLKNVNVEKDVKDVA
jgi:hypothetical protein